MDVHDGASTAWIALIRSFPRAGAGYVELVMYFIRVPTCRLRLEQLAISAWNVSNFCMKINNCKFSQESSVLAPRCRISCHYHAERLAVFGLLL